jgi:hypothetical protein
VPETDALTDAERLGDGVDDVDVTGRLALAEGRGGGELLAWNLVGAVQRETVACPGCGGSYVVDDEAAETLVCPGVRRARHLGGARLLNGWRRGQRRANTTYRAWPRVQSGPWPSPGAAPYPSVSDRIGTSLRTSDVAQ